MKFILFFLTLIAFMGQVYASGGGGGRSAKGQEDNKYLIGKSIVSGRHADYSGISLCVEEAGELLPLAGSQLKNFNTESQLIESLHNCDNQQPIVGYMPEDDLKSIKVYLNRRYNLEI